MIKRLTNTIRGRLTLWYASSVVIILSIFIVVTGILFWFTLKNQVDHHTHIVVNEASLIIQQYTGNERDELLKSLVSAQGMTIILLSPDGTPLIETNSPDIALVTEHQLQGIMASVDLNHPDPVHFTQRDLRFAAKPIPILGAKGMLAVGYSTQVIQDAFISLAGIGLATLLLVVVPAGYVGYHYLSKLLQPLESIASQAQKISSSDHLTKRIEIGSSTQELTAIQSALNSMLSQLQQFFTNERQFFSDAAHTLKTPLAIIKSQVENLASNDAKKPVSSKLKQDIINTIDSTNDTIQDLLFLAKVESRSQTKEQVHLSNLLQNVVELATTLGDDKNIKVTANIPKGIKITAVKALLSRALSNITHNAVKYNRPGGTIHFMLKEASGIILIEISDTGKGIAKKDQTKLFTRFYRGSNENSEGSGLGLAIAKTVINDLGGEIKLNSSLNQGTTVTITLPN